MGREKSKKTRGERHGDTKATGVGKQGQKSGSPEPGGSEDTPYGAGVQPLSGGGGGKDHFPSALEGMGSLEEEVQASEERVLPAADGFVLGREPRLALGGREAAGDGTAW